MMVENLLKLAACLVSGKPYCVKEFQKTLLTVSQIPDEKVHSLMMSELGEIGLAGVLNEKLILFICKRHYKILDFPFKFGNEYRTINLHRSSISVFHEYIDGSPVGKHLRICSVVSSVFNLRPPKPRYMFVSDVKQVLDFVKENFGDNSQLSNKELTIKSHHSFSFNSII